MSDKLRADFEEAGYPLCTDALAIPGLIEVYPHPALIELTGAARRLCYKFDKRRKYWKLDTESVRRRRLIAVWEDIQRQISSEIEGIDCHLRFPDPERASNQEWKSHEDMLDAIVCAWVAICALGGRAVPFGDQVSAIWIPTSARVKPMQLMEIKERRPADS